MEKWRCWAAQPTGHRDSERGIFKKPLHPVHRRPGMHPGVAQGKGSRIQASCACSETELRAPHKQVHRQGSCGMMGWRDQWEGRGQWRHRRRADSEKSYSHQEP